MSATFSTGRFRRGKPAADREKMTKGRVAVYVALALVLFVSIAPLLVVLKTALSSPKGFYSSADKLIPSHPTLFNFKRALGMVSNEESIAAVRALLDLEGVFAGVSAGAVVHVARKLADELDEGVVVCILADGGWKYLSADFWGADDVAGSMERTLWW